MSHVPTTQKKVTYDTRSSRRVPPTKSAKLSEQSLTDVRHLTEDPKSASTHSSSTLPRYSQRSSKSQHVFVQSPQHQSSSQLSCSGEMEKRKIKNKKKKRSTCHTSEEKYLNGNGVYAGGASTASTRSHKERHSERGAERREARDRDTQTVGVQSVDPIIVSTCDPSPAYKVFYLVMNLSGVREHTWY